MCIMLEPLRFLVAKISNNEGMKNLKNNILAQSLYIDTMSNAMLLLTLLILLILVITVNPKRE